MCRSHDITWIWHPYFPFPAPHFSPWPERLYQILKVKQNGQFYLFCSINDGRNSILQFEYKFVVLIFFIHYFEKLMNALDNVPTEKTQTHLHIILLRISGCLWNLFSSPMDFRLKTHDLQLFWEQMIVLSPWASFRYKHLVQVITLY